MKKRGNYGQTLIKNSIMIKKIILVTAICPFIFMQFVAIREAKSKNSPLQPFRAKIWVQTTKYTENFSKYLEKELGIKVKYFIATDLYRGLLKAMRTNKCQIVFWTRSHIFWASEKAGAEALVRYWIQRGWGIFHITVFLLSYPGSGLHKHG